VLTETNFHNTVNTTTRSFFRKEQAGYQAIFKCLKFTIYVYASFIKAVAKEPSLDH